MGLSNEAMKRPFPLELNKEKNKNYLWCMLYSCSLQTEHLNSATIVMIAVSLI